MAARLCYHGAATTQDREEVSSLKKAKKQPVLICPLRQVKADKNAEPQYAKCLEGECAWFVDDDCALTLIARHLTDRKKGEGYIEF